MSETMLDVCGQEAIEEQFNRKHIDTKIRAAIEADAGMQEKLELGAVLVSDYLAGTYHASKAKRVAQLTNLVIPDLVMDIFVGVAYSLQLELFTAVTSQMASRLNFSDRTEAIATVAELIAVLCHTDAFDIVKETRMGSLMLISRIPLPADLVQFIEHSQYLPPMVCEPLKLSHNHSSGYLTHNDSLILGTGNHHDGDICLDVLNTINRVQFKLDLQFLCNVEEEPTFELDSQDKVDQWARFKKQSYFFYTLMAQQGNKMYFNNKVDKRGRIYSCGYHINPQGAAFKKAQLELRNEELVEGVPV
jgi:hypothetical protein